MRASLLPLLCLISGSLSAAFPNPLPQGEPDEGQTETRRVPEGTMTASLPGIPSSPPTASPSLPPSITCSCPEPTSTSSFRYNGVQLSLRRPSAPLESAPAPAPAPTGTGTGTASTTAGSSGSSVSSSGLTAGGTPGCLHPGGPVTDPNAPSMGLYGGQRVQVVQCNEAWYRWDLNPGPESTGVLVSNDRDPGNQLWGLNAEENVQGGRVTIRQIDEGSANQTWTLTETGQLRLTYSDNLCLDSGEDGAQLWECVENNDNQAWWILFLPRPIPIPEPIEPGTATVETATGDATSVGVGSTSLLRPTTSWSMPESVTWAMPTVAPTPRVGGEEETQS